MELINIIDVGAVEKLDKKDRYVLRGLLGKIL